MSDIKFSCPQCQQHIQADQGYAGMQIACPRCAAQMIVPGAAPSVSAVPMPTGTACPGCGNLLATGAVLCTQCGYNLQTGRRMQARTMALPGRPAPAQGGKMEFLTSPNFWLISILVVFGIFYFFARQNEGVALAFLAVQGLFGLGVHITVVVFAFKESAGQGFMTMCIPCYALYFVFGLSENPMLKALYSAAIITNVLSYTLKPELE